VTVLGPFTLPLVWRSPLMTRPAKIVMSVVIGVFSIWVIWEFYQLIQYASHAMAELNSALAQ
jgi:hypothetical protein